MAKSNNTATKCMEINQGKEETRTMKVILQRKVCSKSGIGHVQIMIINYKIIKTKIKLRTLLKSI